MASSHFIDNYEVGNQRRGDGRGEPNRFLCQSLLRLKDMRQHLCPRRCVFRSPKYVAYMCHSPFLDVHLVQFRHACLSISSRVQIVCGNFELLPLHCNGNLYVMPRLGGDNLKNLKKWTTFQWPPLLAG
jgi:hypothetical protein